MGDQGQYVVASSPRADLQLVYAVYSQTWFAFIDELKQSLHLKVITYENFGILIYYSYLSTCAALTISVCQFQRAAATRYPITHPSVARSTLSSTF